MQSITYIVAFILFVIGAVTTLSICIIYADNSEHNISKEKEEKLDLIGAIFSGVTLIGLTLIIIASFFMTQSQYNKAVIGTTMTGKPSSVIIDNNTKVRLNITKDTLSLVPINDSVNIQQANGNTNFKANIVVTYKMVKDEKSILNFYKTYGTSDIKKIVNNEIKSEIAKQADFAKKGQISEQTFKNIQNGLNNTFEFKSMTVTDFVSSNNQNISFTNK